MGVLLSPEVSCITVKDDASRFATFTIVHTVLWRRAHGKLIDTRPPFSPRASHPSPCIQRQCPTYHQCQYRARQRDVVDGGVFRRLRLAGKCNLAFSVRGPPPHLLQPRRRVSPCPQSLTGVALKRNSIVCLPNKKRLSLRKSLVSRVANMSAAQRVVKKKRKQQQSPLFSPRFFFPL